MKTIFALFSFLLLLVNSLSAIAQQKLSGVYGGIEFRVSALVGGGMSRNDRVIYFRPDGSYNDDWESTDWKNNTTGTYTSSNESITLHSKKTGKQQVFTMADDGNLKGRGFKLFKLPS